MIKIFSQSILNLKFNSKLFSTVKQLKDTIVLPDYKGMINENQYNEMYKQSIENNDAFWAEHGKIIDWVKPYTKIKDYKFSTTDTYIKWYYDGTLNASYNCIDRHIKNGKGQKTAFIWEGNEPNTHQTITYNKLHDEVARLANALKEMGVKKGDRVTIYMSMIPEIAYAMLACVRIGAVHSVIFGGFSAESIAKRLDDCVSEFIITVDEGRRGDKIIPLKQKVDEAQKMSPQKVKKVLVVKSTGGPVEWNKETDVWYHDLVPKQRPKCDPVELNAEDPMYILYTSGSTGKPKGVFHTTGGYMVGVTHTHKYIFNYQDNDVYFCTADCGWITGHSYLIYGPLSNGATVVAFEGIPSYPTYQRYWDIVDKHQVNIFYTAPTVLRNLMKEGDAHIKNAKRTSLKVLGTIGEPCNPQVWKWFFDVVGDKRCPIVDTWFQTETGSLAITPIAGASQFKPGFVGKPYFGTNLVILDEKGKEMQGAAEGYLCIKGSFPAQMRSVYRDHERFIKTYFSQFDGYYFTGDGAKRDEDGFYQITGRVDDVIIVSGHNLSTAEIESALVAQEGVAEAAVVGYPHSMKGQGIYCYVTLKNGVKSTKELEASLINGVRQKIGALATPDLLQFTYGVPKTRSGKIMRRILRKIAANDTKDLGDMTSLDDINVISHLIENRLNR